MNNFHVSQLTQYNSLCVIYLAIKYVLGKIKSRMSILMEYSKIWTVDKETYFKTLQANKHNAAEFFDMKITEYVL